MAKRWWDTFERDFLQTDLFEAGSKGADFADVYEQITVGERLGAGMFSQLDAEKKSTPLRSNGTHGCYITWRIRTLLIETVASFRMALAKSRTTKQCGIRLRKSWGIEAGQQGRRHSTSHPRPRVT